MESGEVTFCTHSPLWGSSFSGVGLDLRFPCHLSPRVESVFIPLFPLQHGRSNGIGTPLPHSGTSPSNSAFLCPPRPIFLLFSLPCFLHKGYDVFFFKYSPPGLYCDKLFPPIFSGLFVKFSFKSFARPSNSGMDLNFLSEPPAPASLLPPLQAPSLLRPRCIQAHPNVINTGIRQLALSHPLRHQFFYLLSEPHRATHSLRPRKDLNPRSMKFGRIMFNLLLYV